MKLLFKFLVMVFCLPLASYQALASEGEAKKEDSAIVQISSPSGSNYYFKFISVDGNDVSQRFFSKTQKVEVAPGKHTFILKSTNPRVPQGFLKFSAEAGMIYTIPSDLPAENSHIKFAKASNPDHTVGSLSLDTSSEDVNTYIPTQIVNQRNHYQYYRNEYKRVMADQANMGSLEYFIQHFKDDDPDNLIESVKQRIEALTQEKENARLAEQKHLAEIRKKQAARSLGNQVCYFGNAANGKVRITAFVEQIAKSKLQLRISGIAFKNPDISQSDYRPIERISNFNGSNLEVNSIIWDNTFNWSDCA